MARIAVWLGVLGALVPVQAAAHVSERALVLLLPTGVWIPAGVAAVAASALILFALPGRAVAALFRPLRLGSAPAPPGRLARGTSVAGCALLATLVLAGLTGPRDPLANPLSLAVWTGFWILLPLAQAALGDLWGAINPWSGPAALIGVRRGLWPGALAGAGQLPAVVVWMLFAAFLLADPAPDDPARLARVVGGYWLATMAAVVLFGPGWLMRGEALGIWLGHLARLAPLWRDAGGWRLGLPGARLVGARGVGRAGAVFLMAVLGAGSFDGLNETFWWLALIGVNPLEFPGRSAVIGETLAGLSLFCAGLVAVFAATVMAGLALVGARARFAEAFGRLALSLVPIALGYHLAHYLTVLLVNGQYLLAMLNDPLARGADLLGLGHVHVTTSFFNRLETVRLIWLAQGGAIVLGHVLAVLVAHAIARDMLGDDRRAALSQLPVAVFMTAYTWLGLWILAAPTA